MEADDPNSVVEGKTYQVESEHDGDRLCLYETTAYEVIGVDIEVEGRTVKVKDMPITISCAASPITGTTSPHRLGIQRSLRFPNLTGFYLPLISRHTTT